MLKTQYVKQRLLSRSYFKEAVVIVSLSIIIFFIISLITYSPYDSSWAYATTEGVFVVNSCGIVGAHVAALLCYLFGAASWMVILFLLTMLSFFIKDIPLRYEADRWVAYTIFIAGIAALCKAYGISIWGEAVPGGLIGSTLFSLLNRWFDAFGALLFLYTILLVAIIVITQCSFVHFVYYIKSAALWIVRSSSWLKLICWYLLTGLRFVCHRALSVFLYGVRGISYLFQSVGRYLNVVSIPVEYEMDDDYDLSITDPIAPALLDEASISKESVIDLKNDGSVVLNRVVSEQVPIKPDTATKNIEQFCLPNKDIFIGVKGQANDADQMKDLQALARVLEEKLDRFGVSGSVTSIKSGPVVTLFEYQPDIDSKISKIIALEDDLALALQALSIRIIAPIPGKSVVGFEVSNQRRKNVLFADVVRSAAFSKFSGDIPLILGHDTIGNNVVVDLVKMPHLLVAGSTGSGKSVALNAMLVSILCARAPDEVRLILIDPKRLEFAPYADIAHLLFPIVTEPKDAVPVLAWVVNEMETRYKQMAEKGARHCADYNKIVSSSERVPFIVVVIDELSDLMMTAGREVEGLIVRITQMARAAGIHLIVATQRPSVDVITGLIKVNFPSRVSFRVTSKIDSRTILDCAGADKLLGRGDMLFLDSADSMLKRVHGAYVTDDEIKKVADAIRAQQSPNYRDFTRQIAASGAELGREDEVLYEEVLVFLKEIDEISISLLQRNFRIGYNRSARIIAILESRGLVMPSEGGKTRKIVR